MLGQSSWILGELLGGSCMSSTHIFWFLYFFYPNQSLPVLQNSVWACDFQMKLCWEILSTSAKSGRGVFGLHMHAEHTEDAGCGNCRMQRAPPDRPRVSNDQYTVSNEWEMLWQPSECQEKEPTGIFCGQAASSWLCISSPESCHHCGVTRRLQQMMDLTPGLVTCYL